MTGREKHMRMMGSGRKGVMGVGKSTGAQGRLS